MNTPEPSTQGALPRVYDVSLLHQELITSMAHELRTPIAIIRADTEVALMSRNISDELRLTLGRTIEEVDRMAVRITALVESVRPKA